ncbi:hypothetical protein DPMN_171412 [Dreissena polymorpha]|uniref:Uncharacterized protein n=1 Tax=Dreissena polymorpha TaxID=45954 RepID=A0A9D4E130_DREPO|nr:hypothetical protein DPMN_171412 [Dreissena polymorpha]
MGIQLFCRIRKALSFTLLLKPLMAELQVAAEVEDEEEEEDISHSLEKHPCLDLGPYLSLNQLLHLTLYCPCNQYLDSLQTLDAYVSVPFQFMLAFLLPLLLSCLCLFQLVNRTAIFQYHLSFFSSGFLNHSPIVSRHAPLPGFLLIRCHTSKKNFNPFLQPAVHWSPLACLSEKVSPQLLMALLAS